MTGVQNNTSSNGYNTPIFWAFNPLVRGLGAGVFTELLTGTPFYVGFIYGGVSGMTNLALRPICKKIDEKIISPEAKAANYLFSATLPWGISAGIMRQAYKATGKAFFRINPGVALGTAVVAELYLKGNDDLLVIKE